MTGLVTIRRFQHLWFSLLVQWFVIARQDRNYRAVAFLRVQIDRRLQIDQGRKI
jgi:hypothetical protein